MSDQHVHRLSDRRHPGAALLSSADPAGDRSHDGVGRFEIAKASLRSPHLTATIGAR
jgi:hypothetical protein